MPVGSKGALSEQGAVKIALRTGSGGEKGETTSNVQQRYPKSQPVDLAEAQQSRMQRALIVGQLTSGILHDFNNVLTVITGMIDILAEAVAGEPQLAVAVKLIDEAAIRGAALSSRLLAFARGQPSEPREIDVNLLLLEASRLLRPALGGIEITMAMEKDLPPAVADMGQLMAAVLSLAIAARNAMPAGGALTLRTATGRMHESGALAEGSGEDAIVISLHASAHGYGEIAEHPEQIFTNVGMAEEFVAPGGGRVAILAPSGPDACVEIRLPKVNDAAPWLAQL